MIQKLIKENKFNNQHLVVRNKGNISIMEYENSNEILFHTKQ